MGYQRMYQELEDYIRGLGRSVVAFSGGVDSSLLAYATHQALGEEMIALTVKTPYIPAWEMTDTLEFAKRYAIPHMIIELETPEEIIHNPPDRCYLCKKNLFTAIRTKALDSGLDTVLEGSNIDDLGDYRPGLKALEELGIVSPFLVKQFSKNRIRGLARYLGLEVWNKPSNACLLSRLPYHMEITDSELDRISRADQVLRDMQLFGSRVRSHGDIARVEIGVDQFETVISEQVRSRLVDKLKSCGYLYVALDLEGYQTGSMNKSVS